MFSILLSSLFGIAPKSKTKRSSAWKTIDPLYFYTLKLKKLIPSSLRQFGLQTPFNFYGCFKSRVPDPVFRSASLLRTTFFLFFFNASIDCHSKGVPRTRGDEGSRASAPSCSLLLLHTVLLLTVDRKSVV